MNRSRTITVTTFVLIAYVALMMGACGDDGICPVCPTSEPHPLIGQWECFEAEMNDAPFEPAIGTQMEFCEDGTVKGSMVSGPDDDARWFATDDMLILNLDSLSLTVNYTVEADTFTMFVEDSFMMPLTFAYKYFRL